MWLLCNRTKPVLWGILLLSTHVKSALMCFSSGAGGTGFELGDVSGSGEGGQRKERHSGLGREQFLYYTALTKCCHTKWASSCDFVFVGLLHRVTAQTSRHYRSSPAVSAIVLFLLTCPWGVVTNFALAGQHRGHPTCLESALFLARHRGWYTLLLLRLKPAAFSTATLNSSDLCPEQSHALSHPWRQKGEHEELQPSENRSLLSILPRTVWLSKHHSCACGESRLGLPPVQVMFSPHGST